MRQSLPTRLVTNPSSNRVCVVLSSIVTVAENVAGGMKADKVLKIVDSLKQCGLKAVFATVSGQFPALRNSVEPNSTDTEVVNKLFRGLLPIVDVRASDFCGIIIPDHLGCVDDLFHCDLLGDVIDDFGALQKPVCAIGYGAYGLCHCQNEDANGWKLSGRLLTSVSFQEESRQPHFGHVAAVVQDWIEEHGGNFVECPADEPCVIVGGNVITGPNDKSTALCVSNFAFLANPTKIVITKNIVANVNPVVQHHAGSTTMTGSYNPFASEGGLEDDEDPFHSIR